MSTRFLSVLALKADSSFAANATSVNGFDCPLAEKSQSEKINT
jgi:hypothetical protein